jgi:hypothetical protein
MVRIRSQSQLDIFFNILSGYHKFAGRILSIYIGKLKNLSGSVEENVLMSYEMAKDLVPYIIKQFGRMDMVKAARELVLPKVLAT